MLDVSRSSVYYRPGPISEEDLALMRRVDEIHLRFPFMGSRKIRDMLLMHYVPFYILLTLDPIYIAGIFQATGSHKAIQ